MDQQLSQAALEFSQDWSEYRRRGWADCLRERPAKGVRRSLLVLSWLGIHAFEAVAITVYGLPWGPSGAPVSTVLWLVVTTLAGLQYVRLVFSDPGFLTPESLQSLMDAQVGPGKVDVRGTPEVRGEIVLAVEDCRSMADGTSPSPSRPTTSIEQGNAQAEDGDDGAVSVREVELKPVLPHTVRLPQTAEDALQAEEDGEEDSDPHDGDGDANGGASSLGPHDASGLEMGLARVIEDDASGGTVRVDADGEVMTKERAFWEEREELTRDNSDKTGLPLEAAKYFDGYCEEAGVLLPIRAKWVKKHQRVVSKFDHYCYCLGNSVGELNHGAFWRLLALQLISIWIAKGLVDHAYVHTPPRTAAGLINLPLLILDGLAYAIGIPLTILFCIHSFMALTSSTTHEFMKVEKLQYLKGFYEFSCPFSEGLWLNLKHFCCPKGLRLWERPLPEREWPESFWRNRYYSCFG